MLVLLVEKLVLFRLTGAEADVVVVGYETNTCEYSVLETTRVSIDIFVKSSERVVRFISFLSFVGLLVLLLLVVVLLVLLGLLLELIEVVGVVGGCCGGAVGILVLMM